MLINNLVAAQSWKLRTLLLVMLLAYFPTSDCAADSGPKPNVIVILADDLGYADVGFNGCQDIPTPHIDSLANDGARCTNGYVSFSVCSPSRAGLITGRYQQRFGHERNPIYNPLDEQMGLPLTERTLADVLGDAGYVSTIIGKWHLGAHEVFHPLNRGFDEFFGFLSGGHNYFPEAWTLNGGGFLWEGYRTKLIRNRKRIEETEYLTRALSREGVSFVENHRDEPFFLYLSYNAPHSPLEAPRSTVEKFKSIKLRKRRKYAAMVSELDDGVGILLEKLEELELDSNTLIFFLSDNGGPEKVNASDNGPLRGQKKTMYEGGLRVPFAVRWSEHIPAGTVYEPMVSALDIFATAVELAEAQSFVAADKPLDGVNLVPYLDGTNSGIPHETLFWRHAHVEKRAIRQGPMKLVQPKPGLETALYDLSGDIAEAKDLSLQESQTLSTLDRLWQAWNEELVEPAFLGLEELKEYKRLKGIK